MIDIMSLRLFVVVKFELPAGNLGAHSHCPPLARALPLPSAWCCGSQSQAEEVLGIAVSFIVTAVALGVPA